MDHTLPALTRSPASSPNTCCPSETSSLDYPSPILVDQHYKIASLYAASHPCSMANPIDHETSLPSLDSMTATDWASPAGIAAVSSSSSVPNILSPDYDPFANYEQPTYSHDTYPPQTLPGAASVNSPHPGTDIAARSPGPTSSRHTLSFAHSPHIRVKLEGSGECAQAVDVSHYPSPRSIPAPYGADTGTYANPSTAYMEDTGDVPAWSKQEFESDNLYHSPASSTTAYGPESRRQFRLTRPRRAPRRLTTREEANFQCEVKGCGKLFSRSYNFKAHMETHDEKREYPFPCPVGDCGKKFVRKTDLQRHHQSVHMKERNHKCDYCGRLFARKDTLRRHMEDGCSKRFDISTMDLRAEGYDAINSGNRSVPSSNMNQALPPSGSLPPLSIAACGGNGFLSTAVPPMRNRSAVASPGDAGQMLTWPR